MPDTRSQRGRRSAFTKIAVAALILVSLTLAWYLTPLSSYASLDGLRAKLESFARTPYGALIGIGGFILAGFVAFPITVVIAATAAAFGPALGVVYATIGILTSAAITFAIGSAIGRATLLEVLGPRLEKLRQLIVRRGVIAIATIRVLPIAPFTVINLAAGASEVRLLDFMLGTALGLAPAVIVLSLLGGQIVEVLSEPSWVTVGVLALIFAVWIGLTVGGQYLISRRHAS